MQVSEAVRQRASVRAFLPDPLPGEVVRALVLDAAQAPSGGNLQPWRVHALGGARLAAFRTLMHQRLQESPAGEEPEYPVYPENLWEPYRSRRFQVGEDLYRALGVARENKLGRLMQFAKNYDFFGAPVGLFITVERRMGAAQWVDLGMYLQTLMLLAIERGLDTCAQEAWSRWPQTVGDFLGLDGEHMLFCGVALGKRDPEHAVNAWRARRAPLEEFASFEGF
jgi:nitroreductase